jgi:hypothetical protein
VESPRAEVGDNRLPKEITQCRHWVSRNVGRSERRWPDQQWDEGERESGGNIGPTAWAISFVHGRYPGREEGSLA